MNLFGFGTMARAKAKAFFGDSGAAAIEFAFLLPVLTVGILSISDVANIAIGESQMQSAVRASIQYAMNGGTDMSVAQTQGTSAWSNKPPSGTLTVTKSCLCGSAAGTCGQLCADGSVPSTYVTAVASATLGGNVISTTKSVTESVRTQ